MPVLSLYCLLIDGELIDVYVMPVASPFCLLIGIGLIGSYVMSVTSKRTCLLLCLHKRHL
ncbi:hypothetical protein CE330_14200 [Salmonella enterica]|nr:hypothetical protein [Salmonella enterica]EBJ4738065.1 hypothetical protein [Salmonella enterica]